jgi:hypothetical protein
VRLDEFGELEVARHQLHGDLEETRIGACIEIHDERRIERDVLGRRLDGFFLRRLRGVAAAQEERCAATGERQCGEAPDQQGFLRTRLGVSRCGGAVGSGIGWGSCSGHERRKPRLRVQWAADSCRRCRTLEQGLCQGWKSPASD